MNKRSFGDVLLERGLISSRQFQEASQAVVLFGGRLGSHLVESGALDVDALEQALADHLGVPRAPLDALERPKPDAIAAVPRELAERLRVLAFRREGEALHVAMTDPWDCEAAERLLHETGLRVVPYLVSDTRMRSLLRLHFDETAAKRRALGIDALAPNEELMNAESFAALHDRAGRLEPKAGPRTEPAPRTVSAPTALAPSPPESLDAFLRASNPWEAVRRCLDVAVCFARVAAFFVVRDRMAGLQAAGQVVRRDLTGVFAGESLQSPLLRAAATGRVTRGALCRDGERALIAALGSPAGEAVVLPVKLRGRVVNLLYVEGLIGGPPDLVCAALMALAEGMGRVYEELVQGRKLADRQKERS
jgi:hypothetical protein